MAGVPMAGTVACRIVVGIESAAVERSLVSPTFIAARRRADRLGLGEVTSKIVSWASAGSKIEESAVFGRAAVMGGCTAVARTSVTLAASFVGSIAGAGTSRGAGLLDAGTAFGTKSIVESDSVGTGDFGSVAAVSIRLLIGSCAFVAAGSGAGATGFLR